MTHVAEPRMTSGVATDPAEDPSQYFLPADASVTLFGPASKWFDARRSGYDVMIIPKGPVPARTLIRPAALFRQSRGFPDVNTVMGRMLFQPGATDAQSYRPFTRDSERTIRQLFILAEPAPFDDLFVSRTRWQNYEHVAQCLLDVARVPWNGLAPIDLAELASSDPWQEPLEGCVLYALAQWVHGRGSCVIEIGSLQGLSLNMLARGLRAAKSDSMVVSIDPHEDQPLHRDRVRLALSTIGQQRRLVQFPCRSDDAHPILKPESASMIFIDGDHAYEQVVADFGNYANIVAPGGCLVFHDYGYGRHNGKPDVVPDVRRALDDHVMKSGVFSPLLLAHTLMAFVKES